MSQPSTSSLDASEVDALCLLAETAATTSAPERIGIMSASFSSLDSGEIAACCEAAAAAEPAASR